MIKETKGTKEKEQRRHHHSSFYVVGWLATVLFIHHSVNYLKVLKAIKRSFKDLLHAHLFLIPSFEMRLVVILIALHASFSQAFMSFQTNVFCNLNTSTCTCTSNPYLVPKMAASSGSTSHAHKCTSTRTITTTSLSMNKSDNDNDAEFKPNRPIDLPSLNPQDAGPMYATCRSVTGVEKGYETEDDVVKGGVDVDEEFIANKPIELESLKQQPTTFFGLEPKEDSLREKDGSLMTDAGLPVFTSTVITLGSIYFIYLALFGEDVLMDPSTPLAF